MSGTTAPRGADLLVQELERRGVRRVFTLSGNQIMSVFDASIDTGLELVHVRHEAAAVHMADAWGRLTGEPGVALITAGPGHANAISAMYTALAAESPLVVLSGHAARASLGRGAFQEMPQVALAAEVTKHAVLAGASESLGVEVGGALDLAVAGRPGPVHLSLPEDALTGVASHPEAGPCPFAPRNLPEPSATALGDIRDRLSGASRPLLVAGPAAARGTTGDACAALAERLGIPLLAMESPRGLRDPALGGCGSLIGEADLIVLLGRRIDFGLRFGDEPAIAPGCTFVQVDAEASVLESSRDALRDPARRIIAVHADVERAAIALTAMVDTHPASAWTWSVETAREHRPAEWAALRSADDAPLHPVELFAGVQRHLDAAADSVVVCDGGEVGQWAQACLRGRRHVTNGPAGAIGAALPYGIAASAAFPGATVVAVSGDGAFGFHPAELETAVRAGLPLVFIVANDERWNAEHQIQLTQFGPERLAHCDLGPARYDMLAEALGAHGEHVTRPGDLAPALERAFAAGRPACVDVRIAGHAAPVIGPPVEGGH